MKCLLAVTMVLEVTDRAEADATRLRLLELVRSDPAVVVASAPFPVAGR